MRIGATSFSFGVLNRFLGMWRSTVFLRRDMSFLRGRERAIFNWSFLPEVLDDWSGAAQRAGELYRSLLIQVHSKRPSIVEYQLLAAIYFLCIFDDLIRVEFGALVCSNRIGFVRVVANAPREVFCLPLDVAFARPLVLMAWL